jgi:hypothetical protein
VSESAQCDCRSATTRIKTFVVVLRENIFACPRGVQCDCRFATTRIKTFVVVLRENIFACPRGHSATADPLQQGLRLL